MPKKSSSYGSNWFFSPICYVHIHVHVYQIYMSIKWKTTTRTSHLLPFWNNVFLTFNISETRWKILSWFCIDMPKIVLNWKPEFQYMPYLFTLQEDYLNKTRTGTEGDKNTPKPRHGHNPAMTKQTWGKKLSSTSIIPDWHLYQVSSESGWNWRS